MLRMNLGLSELLIIIFGTYWIAIEILKRKGVLKRKNITAIGPVLMIRTTRGLKLLEKISKPKKFWRVVATLGIPAVFAGMVFMFSLILLMDYIMITSPPKPSPATNPRNALLIPGINEFIPFVWGIIGLIVTLVVHEFSHAILCRVEGVKVKALGVLFALIPIGGFAEPDESELMDEKRLKRIQRIRIFSAGVISNFIVAFIAFSTFFYFLGFLQPHVVVLNSNVNDVKNGSVILSINGVKVYNEDDVEKALNMSDTVTLQIRQGTELKTLKLKKIAGVYIAGVLDGYPAEKVGIRKGDVIVAINGVKTPTLKEFIRIMKSTKPNETLAVSVYNGTIRTVNITLTKSPQGNHGFMGVLIGGDFLSGMVLGYSDRILANLRSIPSQLLNVRGWLYVIAMPFMFQGFSGKLLNCFTPTGFWKDLGNFIFYLLNTLYWIGWINFYVGLFNCLPAIPLDGGRIFQETLMYVFKGEKGKEISVLIVRTLAVTVFLSILLSIVVPNLH